MSRILAICLPQKSHQGAQAEMAHKEYYIQRSRGLHGTREGDCAKDPGGYPDSYPNQYHAFQDGSSDPGAEGQVQLSL